MLKVRNTVTSKDKVTLITFFTDRSGYDFKSRSNCGLGANKVWILR
ncbi:GSCOCT00014295001.2-RA-CDS [Cotesia congregata]|uniref:Cc_single_15.1 n=1 Tax=Cotesia congregata TaxID=51543 RepID=S6CVR1_COTCN|nr:GSCOCT00014295001.2-RA-CDS [Cotesia congregata]CAG5092513.1 cc_single_15.1 [Cotesia congregata]CCQ71234.1 hypothetical protein CcBV_15.1 [Cotesia congregata]